MTQVAKLDVRRDLREDTEILHVRGELDLTTTDGLEAALDETRATRVILELNMLTFVDSAGIRSIDLANRAFREAGRSLVVVARPESRAAWTFRVAGFGEDTVLGSVDDAVDALPRP
jgi:anti-anti-sigma factor